MMDKDKYWKLSDEERNVQDIIDAKETEPKVKYYLWDYCRSYGWRQGGNMDGYDSIEELKKEHSYKSNLEDNRQQRILKASIIDEVKE